MDAGLSTLIGAILGAFAAGLIARVLDIRRRYERETELVVALHAEIVASLKRTAEQTKKEERSYASLEQDPFGIADETDYVFESVKADPATLPKKIVYPIIRYYKLAGQSNAQTKGLLLPAFMTQKDESKRKYVGQLLDLLDEQFAAGLQALESLENEAARRGQDDLPALRKEAGIEFAAVKRAA
jgi:hypothetical protein